MKLLIKGQQREAMLIKNKIKMMMKEKRKRVIKKLTKMELS